jgi:hypothetical protein
MGYVLLWIENLAVSLLLVATVIACVGRIRLRWLRLAIWFSVGLIVFLPYLVLTIATGIFKFFHFYDVGFYPILLLMLSYLVGTIWLVYIGLRTGGAEPGAVPAASWPRGKLALAFGVAVALHLMTFWNLDLEARQQLAALRTEAGAIAMSVAPPRVPDKDNAALLYEQAAQALNAAIERMPKEPEKDKSQTELGSAQVMKNAWDRWLDSMDKPDFNPQDPELVTFLQQQSGVISLLLKAAKKPGCYFEHQYDRPNIEMLFPELHTTRQNARLLALDARCKAATGDLRAAFADLNAMFALAQNVSNEPMLIATLVGCAIDSMAKDTLQTILAAHQPGAEELEIVKINTAFSYQKQMQRALRYEEAFRFNIYCDIGKQYGFFNLGSDKPSRENLAITSYIYHVFLMDNELKAERWYSKKIDELAAKPYYQVKDQWRNLEQDFGHKPSAAPQSMLVASVFPALERYVETMVRADAQRSVAELALAMCRYRAAMGKYPESLQELAPHLIAFVPIDPFDGKPIRLKQSEEEIVIYSVGPDGIDNGGVPYDPKTRKGDIIFKLPQAK